MQKNILKPRNGHNMLLVQQFFLASIIFLLLFSMIYSLNGHLGYSNSWRTSFLFLVSFSADVCMTSDIYGQIESLVG